MSGIVDRILFEHPGSETAFQLVERQTFKSVEIDSEHTSEYVVREITPEGVLVFAEKLYMDEPKIKRLTRWLERIRSNS